MDNENIKEALKGMVETVRLLPAVRRRENVRCAYVVKVGYEEIRELRNDGYSYDTIRDALVASGVFEEGTKSGSLCSAFWRETKRRARREQAETVRSEDKNSHEKPEKGKSAAISDMPDASGDDARRKRIRELTAGPVVKAGMGTVRRLPGGTFEF